jgi:hypothetical protein
MPRVCPPTRSSRSARRRKSPGVARALRIAFRLSAACALIAAVAPAPAKAQSSAEHHPRYDYPTDARADYVIGCLAANGFNRALLQKCACGIDTIADYLPYEDYEKASTILSMQQGGLGERGAMFRNSTIAKEELAKLHSAEAEAALRCK